MSWLAIILSIVTIILFFVKVEPNSIVNLETFLSVVVGLVGVIVTILVGYQIYEAVEINKKLQQIEEIKNQVQNMKLKLAEDEENTKLQFDKRRIETEEQRCMLSYYSFHALESPIDAFLRLHEALKFSMTTDTIKHGLSWYFDELKTVMLAIFDKLIVQAFHAESISTSVELFRKEFEDSDWNVRNHENYYVVKEKYDNLMSEFNCRLENIAKGLMVSPEKIDGVIPVVCELQTDENG